MSDNINEIKITLTYPENGNGKPKFDVSTNIPHDDLVMYWLIEAMWAIRNKQYEQFYDSTKQ